MNRRFPLLLGVLLLACPPVHAADPPSGGGRRAVKPEDSDALFANPGMGWQTVVTKTSIRGWLPGRREEQAVFEVPAGMPEGEHGLALAIVDPISKAPAVRLAIRGRRDDGWYPLSRLRVGKR